ncbi:MAG TPA: VCBS repeat-containing protein, partial [Anaeromyxobacteraceae bacterium]|nr:VCBS repeat-containing protein [Anaeromyxobacteraceae bacterium]
DGRIDLAAELGATVRILPNTGSATFGTPVAYPSASAGWYFTSLDRLRAGDLDGDGRPDLAVREYDGSIRIAWNGATNPFSTKTDLALTGKALDLALADANGDGALDVLAALNEDAAFADDQALGVALNAGSRNFAAPRAFPVGGSASALALGDGNGDGKLDAAVAQGTQGTWLEGVGDGTFVASVRSTLPLDQDVTRSAVADLNGDGLGDLAMATWRFQSVGWALSNGDGTFGPFTFTAGGPYVTELAVGDLTGDGKPEIVTSNSGQSITYAGAGVSVYVNDGNGSFAPQVTYAFGPNAVGLALGDVNEDGKLDVVSYNYNSQIAIFLGNGDGTLQAPVLLGFSTYTVADLRVADVDGDGRSDLVSSVLSSGNWLVVCRNKGGATIADRFANSVAAKISTPSYGDIALADVTLDGMPDVLMSENGGGFGLFVNQGSNAFTRFGSTQNVLPWAGDVDGDGRPDLVAYGARGLGLLRGLAGGNFEAAPASLHAPLGRAQAAGDVTGDGRPDLVTFTVSSTWDAEVYVLPTGCR